jgi:hypothetical protein
MRRVVLLASGLCAALSLAAFGLGQEIEKPKPRGEENEKGKPPAKAEAGKDLPGPRMIHPYNVTGAWGERKVKKNEESKEPDLDVKGQFHDPIGENNLDPCILLFIKEVEPSKVAVEELLQKLDARIAEAPAARLHVVAVFYSQKLPDVTGLAASTGDPIKDNEVNDKSDDDREKFAKILRDLADTLKLKHVVLCLDGRDDVAAYLDPRADVSVVGYKRLKVEFVRHLAEADVKAAIEPILADAADKLGAKPPE